MMQPDNVHLVAYADNPLALLAQHLLDDYSEQLPDLSQAVILLAEPHAEKQLRQQLQQQAQLRGYPALLLPRTTNLRDWAKSQFSRYAQGSRHFCGQHQRELILFNALREHRHLPGSGSPWHLTDDLLHLFDQLTANLQTLPDDYSLFEKNIAEAYGLSVDAFPALGQEARLVYTLWQAWHEQLNAEKLVDNETACLLGMAEDLKHNQQFLYIAGYHQFSLSEQQWLQQLLQQNRCRLYLHGQTDSQLDEDAYHPDMPVKQLLERFCVDCKNKPQDGYNRFLNQVYAHETAALSERVKNFPAAEANTIKDRLQLLYCQGQEQQAHAVELQVRRWLIAGKKNIGIVTENRRLARRVRALLERAGVPLQDYAGWALSTTRAAAVLERWLECVEEDFTHTALLDLLKSPFVFVSLDSQQVKQACFRLENDIIRHENIARNIQKYKSHIQRRAEKLQWSSETSPLLHHMLDTLDEAARLLRPLLKGKHRAEKFIQCLAQSLNKIGMQDAFAADAAGIRILEMFETLLHSSQQAGAAFYWHDFRTWLGRSLEKFVFIPEQENSPVSLMGLGQSRLQRFDALIIASAEKDHLPGKTSQTPFFNNAVRSQLDLATTHSQLCERFHHFRRLLEAADEVLITASHEEEGEAVPLSPWLEIIQHFYQLAFNKELYNETLQQLMQHPDTYVVQADNSLPTETSQPLDAILPLEQVPKQYSASSYQKLLDCPYQFFASYGLSLSSSEEVQEALSKSDYGERVHRCLQAFHSNVEGLPGPFTQACSHSNREAAIQLLTQISEQVFAFDIEDNFEHRGWLYQWMKLVPAYIDWQIAHGSRWKFDQAEQHDELEWQDEIILKGRLDRIDKNPDGLEIIDYKTGSFAKKETVLDGEAVQLPFYALLAEVAAKGDVVKSGYLKLDREVKTGTTVEGDELDTLKDLNAKRLLTTVAQMRGQSALPAWGDSQTCQYCEMDRLCRRQAWPATTTRLNK